MHTRHSCTVGIKQETFETQNVCEYQMDGSVWVLCVNKVRYPSRISTVGCGCEYSLRLSHPHPRD
jgi:hypothetical protein